MSTSRPRRPLTCPGQAVLATCRLDVAVKKLHDVHDVAVKKLHDVHDVAVKKLHDVHDVA